VPFHEALQLLSRYSSFELFPGPENQFKIFNKIGNVCNVTVMCIWMRTFCTLMKPYHVVCWGHTFSFSWQMCAYYTIWCFSDRASWIDCILITNLMHWLLFIHKILFSSTTKNSHTEWQYHMLHVYNCILLKMSTWGSKHVEEKSILWINNNQCIKLVINI